MCGIAGFVPKDSCGLSAAGIDRMLQGMAHRGPDDLGLAVYSGGRVCAGRQVPDQAVVRGAVLLHRRLSILDLADTGWQPMSTPDGRYHLVFNGEIYNYVELREELRRLGHGFRSTSDTEVLLAALAEWGVAALPRLVGMFAFALLDTREERLTLARDFFGIKPLYYAHGEAGLAFASEIKTLLEMPGIDRTVNPQRLYDYLRYGLTDHGEETMFAQVRQVPAAHFLHVDLRTARAGSPIRYWKVDLEQRAELSFEEAASAVRDHFLENVALHLRSDVPVGAALSGGIDSSAIVMAMRHLQPELELHAFSYLADDPAVSEERWADVVVEAAAARAHKIGPTPDDLLAELDRLIWTQDEPFGSTSMYAQYRVFRAAADAGVKVMLDGQGADEMLGGYRLYSAARLASLLRQGRPLAAFHFLRNSSRQPGRAQLLGPAGQFLIPAALQGPFRRLAGESLMPRWMDADWFAQRGIVTEPLRRATGRDVLRDQLHETLVATSLPSLLRFEDRNSMAHSVESRVPFLTPGFVQLLLSMPEEYLIAPDGTTKAVFRQAMRGIVPDVILDRKDKVGFATPEHQWLSQLSPWVDQVLGSETARGISALSHPEVSAHWDSVKNGDRRVDPRVWRWLNLVRWAEHSNVVFA